MKQNILFRSPDAVENPVATTAPKKAVTKQLNSDIDLGAVCDKVTQAWGENPNILLTWITQGDFATKVLNFNQTLTNRNTAGSNRPSLTQSINILDKQMDDAVAEVRVYIAKKYKTAGAIAQYPRFGISNTVKGYRFPTNQESRLASIKMMAATIVADGMAAEEYGGDFWQAMLLNYEKAIADASGSDQQVSTSVSAKNVMRSQIKKVLTSLRFVLRGNYPDTYTSVYRTWGWMKEKY